MATATGSRPIVANPPLLDCAQYRKSLNRQYLKMKTKQFIGRGACGIAFFFFVVLLGLAQPLNCKDRNQINQVEECGRLVVLKTKQQTVLRQPVAYADRIRTVKLETTHSTAPACQLVIALDIHTNWSVARKSFLNRSQFGTHSVAC